MSTKMDSFSIQRECEALAGLRAIEREIDLLEEQRTYMAKSALRELAEAVFSDKSIMSFAWAQNTHEYDDQGLYEGIDAVTINPTLDDDGCATYDALSRNYNYRDNVGTGDYPAQVALIVEGLNLIGVSVLGTMISDYDVVTVKRSDSDPSVVEIVTSDMERWY